LGHKTGLGNAHKNFYGAKLELENLIKNFWEQFLTGKCSQKILGKAAPSLSYRVPTNNGEILKFSLIKNKKTMERGLKMIWRIKTD
jgi:hypothetical protein